MNPRHTQRLRVSVAVLLFWVVVALNFFWRGQPDTLDNVLAMTSACAAFLLSLYWLTLPL